MIELYQFAPAWGLPDPSPFCIKLELYLKMAGLPYQLITENDTRKGPKGKIPFIRDAGKTIGDSELIIQHLKTQYGDHVDGSLTVDQRARGHLIDRMLHDSTYWVLLYCRWMEDSGYSAVRQALFAGMPWPLRAIVPPLLRRGLRRTLIGQGLGRHDRDQIFSFGFAQMDTLSVLLGDKPYLLGDLPCSADATAHGFIMSFVGPPIDNPMRDRIRRSANLMAYYQRMNQRFYPFLAQAR